MNNSKDYNKIHAKNNMEVGRDVDVKSESDSQQVSERPKLQGVVGAAPKKIKRSLFTRLISGLIGQEGLTGIGGYISQEVIKPAVKHIIVDSVISGINMAVYGDRGAPNRAGRPPYYSGDARPRTNYSSAYESRPASDNRSYSQQPVSQPRSNVVSSTSRYGVDEYIIPDRYDAAHVLTTLTEYADRYGSVSVADFYDLIKVETKFTDNNYGWRHDSISTARIIPTRGGYVIKFPPVEVI